MYSVFKHINVDIVADILKGMNKDDSAVVSISGIDRDGERLFNVNLNLGIDNVSAIFGDRIVEME